MENVEGRYLSSLIQCAFCFQENKVENQSFENEIQLRKCCALQGDRNES